MSLIVTFVTCPLPTRFESDTRAGMAQQTERKTYPKRVSKRKKYDEKECESSGNTSRSSRNTNRNVNTINIKLAFTDKDSFLKYVHPRKSYDKSGKVAPPQSQETIIEAAELPKR